MTRFWKYSAMVLLALAIFVPAASARPGIIIGGYFGPDGTVQPMAGMVVQLMLDMAMNARQSQVRSRSRLR